MVPRNGALRALLPADHNVLPSAVDCFSSFCGDGFFSLFPALESLFSFRGTLFSRVQSKNSERSAPPKAFLDVSLFLRFVTPPPPKYAFPWLFRRAVFRIKRKIIPFRQRFAPRPSQRLKSIHEGDFRERLDFFFRSEPTEGECPFFIAFYEMGNCSL